MVSKPTVQPVQTSMCESVRLRSMNDMCHDVMQRRTATLTDRNVGNSVCIRTTNASHDSCHPVLFQPHQHYIADILRLNLRINHKFCMHSVWGE